MTITAGQFELNGLVLGAGTDYHVLRTDVFSWPGNRGRRVPEPNLSGYRFDTRDMFNGRAIELEMLIKSADLRSAMDALSVAGFIDEPDATINLDMFLPLDSVTKRAIGRVTSLDFPNYDKHTYTGWTECLLLFETELPSLVGSAEKSSSVALPTSEGGHTFPVTFPMVFGATSSGGLLSITNDGTYPYEPRIRIDGPVVDPKILHFGQDRWLEFRGLTLGVNDWIDIDARNATIMLNGTASRYNTLTSQSRWFTITPGSNSLSYTAAGYESGSLITIYWYDAYL